MSSFDDRAAVWDAEPRRLVLAQAVATAIRAHVPLNLNWQAMEYGCGTGLVGFLLQPYLGHLVMADSSAGMLKVLEEKISHHQVGNMTPTKLDLAVDPLPGDRFHLIFTSMTLHHVAEVNKMLKSFYELLLDDGYLCIADLDREDGSFHGQGFTGHQGFDRTTLQQWILRAGFQRCTFYDAHQTTKMTDQGMRTFSLFLLVAIK